MRRLSPRPLPALAAALSLTLGSASTRAQELPPPPPPPAVPVAAPSDGAAPDDGVRRAVHLLRTRQTEEALALLGRMAQERGVDVRGYDPVAVLYRLAYGRAQPGTPTGGALPPSATPAPPAPPALEGGDLPPPPPSDEVAHARVIDAVVDRLARWDEAGARALLDSALDEAAATGSAGGAFRALGRLARGDGALAGGEPAAGGVEAPAQLLPERPPGTIEGFEVLTLYVSLTAYGGILGTWAGLAATDDRRNGLRAALPLAGLSVGLLGAILLDRSGEVRRGRGYAVNSGLVLGTLAGTAALIYTDADAPVDGWGLALGGATLGIGAALGVAHLVDALPGSVSYVTSAGLWGSMVGLSMSLALDDNRDETVASAMLIGEGVGAVLAMLSAGALQPTPGQTRWADLGACVGGILGGSIAAGSDSPQVIGVGMAFGILGGGALAWYLAAPSEVERAAYLRSGAAREPPLRLGVSPLPGGAIVHVGL